MPIDPSQTYVLLAADGRAIPLPGGEAFWSRPKSELDEIGQSWLVSRAGTQHRPVGKSDDLDV